MYVSPLETNFLKFYSNERVSSRNNIFFGNKKDIFEKNNILSVQFVDGIDESSKKQILSEMKNIIKNQDEIKPLGIGATGVAYVIETDNSNKVVAKISHNQEINPYTGEKQKIDCTFDDEISILKHVKSLGSSSQQLIGKIKLQDGRNVLLTSFVSGKNPDFNSNPITLKHLKMLLNSLEKLDEASVLHRDLKKENILLSDDSIKLIDYGESLRFDLLDIKKNDKELNFIPFEVPTNIQNFEDTFLSPYLAQMMSHDKKYAYEFYKKYLNMKSELIYSKKAKFLEEKLSNSKNPNNDDLEQLISYQKTMANVLKSPSSDIISLELLRNQITYMSELAYKNEILLANPLANISMKTNAIMSAKKLEIKAKEMLKRPNNIDTYNYLNYQIQYAKYRQEKITGWLTGLVDWFCNCMNTDSDTVESSKQKMILEATKDDLEDFSMPNIARINIKGNSSEN